MSAWVIRRWRSSPSLDRWLAAGIGVTACALWSLLHGQDMNPDLRNYHFASAYRLLHNRDGVDLAVSQVQGFFNPIGYLPGYWLIADLPPLWATLGLSFLHGLNAALAYVVAHALLDRVDAVRRRLLALGCAVLAATASTLLEEAGTSFIDVVVSLPMLGGLCCLVTLDRPDGSMAARRAVLGGGLIGLAIGMKLTALIFLPATVVATGLWAMGRRGGAGSVAGLAAGLALGFAFGGGWWAAHLWFAFDNPVFPMGNAVFRSSWVNQTSYADVRFLPRSALDMVLIPLRIATGTPPADASATHLIASEMPFRDPRYLIGLICAAGLCGAAAARIVRGGPIDRLHWLGIFWLVAYITWLWAFGIARYGVVLEILAGAMLVATTYRRLVARWPAAALWMVGALGLLTVGSTNPPSWWRVGFAGSWFGAEQFTAQTAAGTTYVLTSPAMIGYLEAFLPADARMIRLVGPPVADSGRFQAIADRMIRASRGPIRTLAHVDMPGEREDPAARARAGLSVVPGSCVAIAVKADPVRSCALRWNDR